MAQGLEGIVFFFSGFYFACIPKPYKIVGYDALIIGSNPQNSSLDPQVEA